MWEALIGTIWEFIMGGTLFSCLDWLTACSVVKINIFWGSHRALPELQICNSNNVVKAFSLSPQWMCMRESVCHNTGHYAVWSRGGCIPSVGSHFELLQCVYVWVLSEIVSVFLKSITARVKVQSLKGWDLNALYTGWYALVSAFPTLRAWTLPRFVRSPLSSMNHPAQPLSLCNEGFDVWFDTLGWFINAVVHFLKFLSSQMSNLQDHIHRNPISFLLLGEDLSRSGDSSQSHWLSSTSNILSSYLLPFICKKCFIGSKTWRAKTPGGSLWELHLCIYLIWAPVGDSRTKPIFLCHVASSVKKSKLIILETSRCLCVSCIRSASPKQPLQSFFFCRTCYRCGRLSQTLVKPLSHTVHCTLLFVHYL